LIEHVALAIAFAAGIHLAGLGLLCLAAPARGRRFLTAFASSRRWHVTELAIRMVVGGALVIAAPRVSFPAALSVAGWTLIVTTTVLLAMPWRWHRRVARATVPHALRVLPLLGLSSLVFGAVLLVALARGS
jgi:hypothetical protein